MPRWQPFLCPLKPSVSPTPGSLLMLVAPLRGPFPPPLRGSCLVILWISADFQPVTGPHSLLCLPFTDFNYIVIGLFYLQFADMVIWLIAGTLVTLD